MMPSSTRGASRLILLFATSLLAGCLSSDAKEAVRRQMIDPDATQFRDVSYCGADQELVRGEFNGKNLMGAYTGFKHFYFSRADGVIFVEDDRFSAMVHRCFGKFAEEADRILERDGLSNGS